MGSNFSYVRPPVEVTSKVSAAIIALRELDQTQQAYAIRMMMRDLHVQAASNTSRAINVHFDNGTSVSFRNEESNESNR